ncbi:MAG: RidA family protein, partial [Candidatus Kapaibacterium sp.]
MDNGIINSSRAPEPVGAYPHARRVGDMIFLSGVGPRKRGQKAIPGVTIGEDGS